MSHKIDPALVFTPPEWQKADLARVANNVSINSARPAIDKMTIKLLVDADVPELVLLVNPNELTFAFNKKINEVRARKGWVPEHWGSELDKINASGTSPGLYISKGDQGKQGGLTRYYRRETSSFGNIRSLEMMFRNNGYNFLATANSAALSLGTGVIETVGKVSIQFRNKTWLGRFDDFTLEEVAERPFFIRWTFTFTVHQQQRSWYPGNVQLFKNGQKQAGQKEGGDSQAAAKTISSGIPSSFGVNTVENKLWSDYEKATVGSPNSSPLVVSSVTDSFDGVSPQSSDMAGIAAQEQLQGCINFVQASFDQFLQLEAGSLTEAQLQQELESVLDVRTARYAWGRLKSILLVKKQPGTSITDLLVGLNLNLGILNLEGIVNDPPFVYDICPLLENQLAILQEMV